MKITCKHKWICDNIQERTIGLTLGYFHCEKCLITLKKEYKFIRDIENLEDEKA